MHFLTLHCALKIIVFGNILGLQASWLLEAYCADGWLPSKEYARGTRLLHLILEEYRPKYVKQMSIKLRGYIKNYSVKYFYCCSKSRGKVFSSFSMMIFLKFNCFIPVCSSKIYFKCSFLMHITAFSIISSLLPFVMKF